jgi:hypothetical protein
MEREPLSSTNIVSAGWEENIMEVEFANGATYQYQGVPEDVFIGLKHADSKGKFLASNVKNVFPYTRVS